MTGSGGWQLEIEFILSSNISAKYKDWPSSVSTFIVRKPRHFVKIIYYGGGIKGL